MTDQTPEQSEVFLAGLNSTRIPIIHRVRLEFRAAHPSAQHWQQREGVFRYQLGGSPGLYLWRSISGVLKARRLSTETSILIVRAHRQADHS